jgi:hypothetical protein
MLSFVKPLVGDTIRVLNGKRNIIWLFIRLCRTSVLCVLVVPARRVATLGFTAEILKFLNDIALRVVSMRGRVLVIFRCLLIARLHSAVHHVVLWS